MERRLLVLGAGSGASNNLIRSLKAGEPALFVVGGQSDRFVLKKSPADRNYLIPRAAHPDFPVGLRSVLERERIDLLVPNSDADVRAVAALSGELPCRVFLPDKALIDLCQDKYALTRTLRARGVPAPATLPVTEPDSVEALFAELGWPSRLWCRVRRGQGSLGAIPVKSPDQARSWIRYWTEMRGVPATDFTLSEYLPGRDFAVQGLWKRGRLVLIKTCERLAYFGGGSQPSGQSSTPALGKTVFEPRVVGVCADAIRALDETASGIFSIDLKESAGGVPCITEINAGRFCMITSLFDSTGTYNMALTYVRLALDEPVEIPEAHDVGKTYYLVRDLDTLPGIFHEDELFEGVLEPDR